MNLPETQPRPKAVPTESDLYFKTVLASKLESHDPFAVKRSQQKGGKFNLRGLLGNAVYPAECPEEEYDSILNASCLPHLVKSSMGKSSDMSFLNDTQVDEEVVHSLSQRQANFEDTCECGSG